MGTRIIRHLACLGLGLAIIGGAFIAPARAAEPGPEKFLGALAREAVAVLSDDGLDQAARTAAFRKLLRRGFDLPAVSRFVLGRYWRRASIMEREEFSQLFEDYVVATYGRRLGRLGGDVLRVSGQRADGRNGAIVHSRISAGQGPAIKVDWRLRHGAEGWRVVDIMVEGVSLALAQRSEFATVIRGTGGRVSGLLAKLRQKTQTLALVSQPRNSPSDSATSMQ
jgi:phospholipid transport system substrate-binding protein